MNRLGILVTALALVAAACGGTTATTSTVDATTATAAAPAATTTVAVATTEAATATTVTATTTTVAAPTTTLAPFEATGPSVLVNGGWLAYECRGEGSPTVVIDHGLIDVEGRTERDPNWWAWGRTVDMIAETNTVCAYGRRGVFGSEPVPSSPLRTTQDQVDDLNGLIDTLELETPVILVGHSQGGFNIRLLAGQNPDKVAGLVFVDGSDPIIDGFVPTPDPSPPEWLDLVTSGIQASAVQDLGDLPVYVLTATIADDVAQDGTVSDRPGYWFDVQDSLLALSTNSLQTMVEATHNNIYWARPDTIVEAIAWVEAQTG